MKNPITIIGGGLAGVEAAYQITKAGIPVRLYEMRLKVSTAAHQTGYLAEMVCSNSLGSSQLSTSSGLLQQELTLLDSGMIHFIQGTRVPAGLSLSVDRIELARQATGWAETHPQIELVHQEMTHIPESDSPVIVASGPLTSGALAQHIITLTQRKNLSFYDATSPIINAESIDFSQVFFKSRYGKGEADFINIPLDEHQYNQFVDQLLAADEMDLNEADREVYFDACLPIEEIARRGRLSLALRADETGGPCEHPDSGKIPFALRLNSDRMTWPKNFTRLWASRPASNGEDQRRVLRTSPD